MFTTSIEASNQLQHVLLYFLRSERALFMYCTSLFYWTVIYDFITSLFYMSSYSFPCVFCFQNEQYYNYVSPFEQANYL